MKKKLNHFRFYELAEIYDIAFDFRDVAAECDFLENVFQKFKGGKPKSFLELAAGPACHSREFARRGLKANALDSSEAMVAYGRKKADEAGIELNYFKADMIDFRIENPVDIAAILMDSTSYLLDNAAVVRHLETVADALAPEGLYVLEMAHPQYVFRVTNFPGKEWDMERGGKKVHIRWGADEDHFDPTSQLTLTTVSITYRDPLGKEIHISEQAPQRCFVPNEFKALVELSGRFTLVGVYGAMDPSVSFDDGRAWRMVPVLQKA